MLKIGLISTHATGKTTLAHLLAGEFKKRGFKAKVIDEVATEAAESSIPINQQTSLVAQAWILHKQITYELQALVRDYEVLVCDRTVLDNYVYLERACGRDKDYLNLILSHAKRFPYNALFRLPLIGEARNDGIRDINADFRKDVDARLTAFLSEFGISYINLPEPQRDGREDWIELILEKALPLAHKTASLEKF